MHNEENEIEATDADDSTVILIYDGECPFCSSYSRLLKLKEHTGKLLLLNAREPHPVVKSVIEQGYNLDQGMVAIIHGVIYHAEESLMYLALSSTDSDLFNKLNHAIFQHRKLARFFYPLLRFGRNLSLKLRGVKPVHSKAD